MEGSLFLDWRRGIDSATFLATDHLSAAGGSFLSRAALWSVRMRSGRKGGGRNVGDDVCRVFIGAEACFFVVRFDLTGVD